jgi:hypothetical protein
MSKSRITKVTQTEVQGKCGEKCELIVHKSHYDSKHNISIRWKKTNKGGEININPLNYDREKGKVITFGGDVYVYSKPIKFTFYKKIDLVINSKTPDCIASIYFETKNKKKDLTVIIPFLTGDKITKGTEILEEIIDSIVQYQPNENDDPSHLNSMSLMELFPKKGTYYEAPEKSSGDKYIIIDSFQAIKGSDMEKLNKLFDLDKQEIADILRIPGIKLNFFSYYRSKNPIQEGMTNRGNSSNIDTRPTPSSNSASGDDIYIDCRPVGVDEETEDVTVKYDSSAAKKGQETLFFIFYVLLMIVFALAVLFLINYLIKKYVN